MIVLRRGVCQILDLHIIVSKTREGSDFRACLLHLVEC